MLNLRRSNATVRIATICLVMSAVLFISTTLLSCGGGGGDGKKDNDPVPSFKIKGLGWVIENIDMEFWNNPPIIQSSCFYSFWINYDGEDPTASDIAAIRFEIAGTNQCWSLPLDDDGIFHPESNTIGSWFRFRHSDNHNALPIGNITAEIEMKNGFIHEYTQVIPAPGKLSTAGFSHTFTEDYTGTSPGTYTPMIKRATGITGSKDIINETITINFTTDDDIAFNGLIVFFNDTNYVGKSDDFVDYKTGTPLATINGGAGLFTDSSTNTVDLDISDIIFEGNYNFNDITRYAVILTDGAQHENNADINSYDCRSVSRKNSL